MPQQTILIVIKLIEIGTQRYGSAAAFARAVGLSRAALSKRKQGFTSVKLEEAIAWAHLLEVSLDELAGISVPASGKADINAVKDAAGRELARMLFERMQSTQQPVDVIDTIWGESGGEGGYTMSEETATIVARLKAQLLMLRAGEELVTPLR